MDIDDVMYTSPEVAYCMDLPLNNNSRDEALLCVTDLIDCCESPHTVRGYWYYPNGIRVEFDPTTPITFRAIRGPSEEMNGRTQIYGSVCFFRRFGLPPGRGRFRCELPNAADQNVNQTLYAIIGEI